MQHFHINLQKSIEDETSGTNGKKVMNLFKTEMINSLNDLSYGGSRVKTSSKEYYYRKETNKIRKKTTI